MTAIPGATHTSRMLVDGTLAITVMVEPRHAQDAFRLLCVPGTAVAMAALKDAPTPEPAPQPEKAKGGERAKWVAMRCNEPDFQTWIHNQFPTQARMLDPRLTSKDAAASIVRAVCGIESRAELDSDKYAPHRFDVLIRKAWQEHCGATA